MSSNGTKRNGTELNGELAGTVGLKWNGDDVTFLRQMDVKHRLSEIEQNVPCPRQNVSETSPV